MAASIGATTLSNPRVELVAHEEVDADTTRARVEVRVVGPKDIAIELSQRLGPSLAGKATLSWSTVSAFAPEQILNLVPLSRVLIHCWVDLTDRKLARLYFVAPAQDRFMMRDLELGSTLGEVEFESLAQIIGLSLEVLLTNTDAGLSRSEARELLLKDHRDTGLANAPETTAPALPRPELHDALRLRVALRYRAMAYAPDVALHGPALSLVLEHEMARHLDLWSAGAEYEWPVRIARPIATVELDRLELGVRGARLWTLGERRAWWLGARFGLSSAWMKGIPKPGSRDGTYALTRGASRYELAVSPEVVLRWDAFRACSAELGVSLALVPKPVRYELTVDGQSESLVEGRRVRPAVEFAMTFP
ncbi:MAG: hypothetical protein QM784_12995 [Polyangiaceae bacterium]